MEYYEIKTGRRINVGDIIEINDTIKRPYATIHTVKIKVTEENLPKLLKEGIIDVYVTQEEALEFEVVETLKRIATALEVLIEMSNTNIKKQETTSKKNVK